MPKAKELSPQEKLSSAEDYLRGLEERQAELQRQLEALDYSDSDVEDRYKDLKLSLEVIPHRIRSARVAVEQARGEHAAEQVFGLEKRIDGLYERLQQAQDRRQEADRVLRQARAEWQSALDAKRDLERVRDRADRNVHAIQNEEAKERAKQAIPPIRSLWQHNFAPDSDQKDDALGADAPASFGFGSANVGDVPLSAEGGQETTVVIPEGALEKHQRKGA